MKLDTLYKKLNPYTDNEVEDILILLLLKCSVRKDMCLPIMLLMNRSRERMMKLMEYIGEENPSESQIIQKALELDKV